jgi:hypothetical protein
MFSPRETGNAQRVLARALVSLFIGTFLLACQPRVADFLASHLPNSENKLLNVGDFLDGVIANRSLKSGDLQSSFRLLAGKVWDYPSRQRVFVRAIDQSIIRYESPTRGSFLIRSPPWLP